MDWKKYLAQTNFRKDTDRILNAFRVGKVITYADLQNAPIKLGSNVVGYSTYQLVAELNSAIEAERAKDVPAIEKVAAASVAKKPVKPKVVKKTEQPIKAPVGKKPSGSGSKPGAPAEKADKA